MVFNLVIIEALFLCCAALEGCPNKNGTNAQSCNCGKYLSICHALQWCIDDDGSCISQCTVTNGRDIIQKVPCYCGYTFCNYSGYTCVASSSTCRRLSCSSTDGLAAVTKAPCQCGDALCNSGQACFGVGDGFCDAPRPLCDNNDATAVVTNAPCSCGTRLTACGDSQTCDSDNDGTCETPALCSIEDGSGVNDVVCACGNTFCKVGQLCKSIDDECSYPACVNTLGTAVADAPCICGGSSECAAGDLCLGSNCSAPADCLSGQTDVPCACGDKTCNVGQICYDEYNVTGCLDPPDNDGAVKLYKLYTGPLLVMFLVLFAVVN